MHHLLCTLMLLTASHACLQKAMHCETCRANLLEGVGGVNRRRLLQIGALLAWRLHERARLLARVANGVVHCLQQAYAACFVQLIIKVGA